MDAILILKIYSSVPKMMGIFATMGSKFSPKCLLVPGLTWKKLGQFPHFLVYAE